MKKMRRSVCLFLLVIIILSSLPLTALAVEPSVSTRNHEEATTWSIYKDSCLYDGAGNQYGRTSWTSLSAAQSYYGTGFSYHSCYEWFRGELYNYFYFFSDGLKMFFGVVDN